MTDSHDDDQDLESIRDMFFQELKEQVKCISDALEGIEKVPISPSKYEIITRGIHSIKGAARITMQEALYPFLESIETFYQGLSRLTEIPNKQQQEIISQTIAELHALSEVETKKFDDYLAANQGKLNRLVDKIAGKEEEQPEVQAEIQSEEDFEQVDNEIQEFFGRETAAEIALVEGVLDEVKKGSKKADALEATVKSVHRIVESSRIISSKEIELIAMGIEQGLNKIVLDKSLPENSYFETIQRGFELIKAIIRQPFEELQQWLRENQSQVKSILKQMDSLLVTSEEKKEIPKPTQEVIVKEEKQPSQIKESSKPLVTDEKYEVEKEQLRNLKFDTNMMELFMSELGSQVNILNQELINYEQQPQNLEPIEVLMRAAHSIKGAAKVVNMEPLVHLAHAMEDCFVAAQKKKIVLESEGIDLLLSGLDIFEKVSTMPMKNIPAWLIQNYDHLIVTSENISRVSKNLPIEKSAEQIQVVVAEVVPPVEKEPSYEPKEMEPQQKAKTPLKNFKDREKGKNDRVLRVTAQSLNQLMGLAGESLVESRWLQPFSDSLIKLKKVQHSLKERFESFWETLSEKKIDEKQIHNVDSIKSLMLESRTLLDDRLSELEMFIRRNSSLSDRLYREVIDSRMRPFADGIESFPRMVRDIARDLGKKVTLDISGKSTQLDREILEKLETPLSHLLRNAIDHGIETPEERIKAGKPAEGVIKMQAYHQAGMLAITISDDGKGVDLEHLKKKIVERKLQTTDVVNNLSEVEILDFLFLPGFTTKEEVTKLSGRGVGLDIVQSMIQEVGGNIQINTKLGHGTEFLLHLPLTLSVIRALLVEISGEPFAFPLARIDRTLVIPGEQIQITENRQYFTLEGQNIGLVPLFQILGMPEIKSEQELYPVVVISDRLNSYGAVVNKFLGERELVVQELDFRLGKVPDIVAGALMEDGAPVLIFDVEDLVRSIDSHLTGGRLKRLQKGTEEIKSGRKRVLVVDDSITVREVESRLLQNKGYEVDTAINGMDGWNAIRVGHYDLVITDIDMPRMNGIELTRAIKTDDRLKNTPVMIVSYKEREADKILGLNAGADYYLTKSSFHDETLIEAVRDLIGAS